MTVASFHLHPILPITDRWLDYHWGRKGNKLGIVRDDCRSPKQVPVFGLANWSNTDAMVTAAWLFRLIPSAKLTNRGTCRTRLNRPETSLGITSWWTAPAPSRMPPNTTSNPTTAALDRGRIGTLLVWSLVANANIVLLFGISGEDAPELRLIGGFDVSVLFAMGNTVLCILYLARVGLRPRATPSTTVDAHAGSAASGRAPND